MADTLSANDICPERGIVVCGEKRSPCGIRVEDSKGSACKPNRGPQDVGEPTLSASYTKTPAESVGVFFEEVKTLSNYCLQPFSLNQVQELERDAYGEGKHRWNSTLLELAEECVFSPRVCWRWRLYRNLYTGAMKTTLNLNDQLLADAKALAAQQRTSLTRLIEEGLQLRLRTNVDAPAVARVRLPVFKGRSGLVKGVSPLSNKALLKALGDDA